MSKKFGKILLLGATVSAAAAAAYYFLRKRDSSSESLEKNDEDYDDFSDDLEEEELRTYVSLSGNETAPEAETEKTDDTAVSDAEEASGENPSAGTKEASDTEGQLADVEEFFDDEDEDEVKIPSEE